MISSAFHTAVMIPSAFHTPARLMHSVNPQHHQHYYSTTSILLAFSRWTWVSLFLLGFLPPLLSEENPGNKQHRLVWASCPSSQQCQCTELEGNSKRWPQPRNITHGITFLHPLPGSWGETHCSLWAGSPIPLLLRRESSATAAVLLKDEGNSLCLVLSDGVSYAIHMSVWNLITL